MRLAPRQQEDIRDLLGQMEKSAETPKAPLETAHPREPKDRTEEPAAPRLKTPDDLTT